MIYTAFRAAVPHFIMAGQPTTPQRRGSWTKVVIFVSLYVLLLESLIEWVLVIYLFVNQQVDSKMLPSLVLILIAVRSLSLSLSLSPCLSYLRNDSDCGVRSLSLPFHLWFCIVYSRGNTTESKDSGGKRTSCMACARICCG